MLKSFQILVLSTNYYLYVVKNNILKQLNLHTVCKMYNKSYWLYSYDYNIERLIREYIFL